MATAPNTQQGLFIASAFPVTTFLLQRERVLLTDNQNLPLLQFIRSAFSRFEKRNLIKCEDLQAQPIITSGKQKDDTMLQFSFSTIASMKKQNMAPRHTKQESNWNLWEDEMNQKSFSSFFSETTNPSPLVHPFSPHLINTPAWAHKIRILHIKHNFKEKIFLRYFTIHHKVQKNTQENSHSLKAICFPLRCWQTFASSLFQP